MKLILLLALLAPVAAIASATAWLMGGESPAEIAAAYGSACQACEEFHDEN